MNRLSKVLRVLVMPKLSPTMTEGVISKLNIKPGQVVASHDAVMEVSTSSLLNTSDEKSVMDIEIIEDMHVAVVFGKVNDVLKVGSPVALLCDSAYDIAMATNLKVRYVAYYYRV